MLRAGARCPLRLIGAGVAAGVELNQDAVRVRYLDRVSDVALDDRRMLQAQRVQMATPALELIAIADAERHRSEVAERISSSEVEMQTHGDSTRVLKNDADEGIFFFDVQDGFEPQHVQVPVAASEDVRHGQPHVVDPHQCGDAIAARCAD
jgi:hypothetical protein